jgi:hypothetical protein
MDFGRYFIHENKFSHPGLPLLRRSMNYARTPAARRSPPFQSMIDPV